MMTDRSMSVMLIDNYDSFTWNLWHYLSQLGCTVTVHRNDALSAEAVIDAAPDAIVLSPGPCTPSQAGICLDVIDKARNTIPLFGVCLGHQAVGQFFGGDVVRLPVPMHGKLSTINHTGQGIFHGLNSAFQATRYHSLVVCRETLPEVLEVTAETQDGIIMAIQHRTSPIHSVQFHPESIMSEHGHRIIANFLDLAGEWNQKNRKAS